MNRAVSEAQKQLTLCKPHNMVERGKPSLQVLNRGSMAMGAFMFFAQKYQLSDTEYNNRRKSFIFFYRADLLKSLRPVFLTHTRTRSRTARSNKDPLYDLPEEPTL